MHPKDIFHYLLLDFQREHQISDADMVLIISPELNRLLQAAANETKGWKQMAELLNKRLDEALAKTDAPPPTETDS